MRPCSIKRRPEPEAFFEVACIRCNERMFTKISLNDLVFPPPNYDLRQGIDWFLIFVAVRSID